METQKTPTESQTTSEAAKPAMAASCRRKKFAEGGSYVQDVRDHFHEFLRAPMKEHQTCFTKTIRKMFGRSKIIAEKNAEAIGVESSLPLRTKVAD